MKNGLNLLAFIFLLSLFSSASATRLVAVTVSKTVSKQLIPEGISDTFSPDSPSIHAVIVFSDVASGTQVKGVWVSIDAIETPNHEIDSSQMTLSAGQARAHFKLSKPNKGWPAGNYRLDIYIDETFVTSATFAVKEAIAKKSKAKQATESSLMGNWQCEMSVNGTPAGGGMVTFNTGGHAVFNGTPFKYQELPDNVLRLQDQEEANDYRYRVTENNLEMHYEDGSTFSCARISGKTQEPGYNQQSAPPGKNMSGTGNEWQLQGTYCNWSGSSSSYSSSSYGSTRRLTFDGNGRWAYGSEASFSSSAGMAYSSGGSDDSGTYQIDGQQIRYQTASGERGVAQVKVRQNNGRITEIVVDGNLYAPQVCE